MTQDAYAIGAAEKLRGLIESIRVTTRMWFDVLAPLAMILVINGRPPLRETLLLLGVLVCFHAGQTYFNDVADVDVDRSSSEDDRRSRALVSHRVDRKEMLLAGTGFVAASAVLCAFLPWPTILILALALVVVLAYNFPPVRLSGRPLATQVFWPAIWTLMYVAAAIAIGPGHWRRGIPFLVFVVMFMGLGESITQDTRDADNDAAGGRRTTVVAYGYGPTAVFAWAVQALSLVPLVWFVVAAPMPLVVAVLAPAFVAVWLVVFWREVARLRRGYHKAAARLTHVGSIYAFTLVNAAVVAGALYAR